MRGLTFFLLGFAVISQAETGVEFVQETGCLEPELMTVPDGHKVSPSEMLKSQADVQAYIDQTHIFLDCLLAAEKALGDAQTFAQQKGSITRYNLAVERVEGLVESFNRELSVFKKANAN